MRAPLAALLVLFAASVAAQSAPRPIPPGSVPLEDPPPPPVVQGEPAGEPVVTTRRENGATIQEYRVKGKLYMMRVTPANGRPYVLVDHKGDGQFKAQDNLDSGLRVPQWVLLEW